MNGFMFVGGVGVCARAIIDALPEWEHTLVSVTDEPSILQTDHAFADHEARVADRLDHHMITAAAADAVIFHNQETIIGVPEGWEVPLLYYFHGAYFRPDPTPEVLHPMGAMSTAACVSHYLADQLGLPPASVWYQPVNAALGGVEREDRRLLIGRLCNPISNNWPAEIVDFFHFLASAHPAIEWEFVGCPEAMRDALFRACAGRVRFHAAGAEAKDNYARWHALVASNPHVTHGYGRTVCEAQIAGCVPIVDHRGGFIEQVEHGVTGFLCVDSEGFSEALAQVAVPARRRAIATRAIAAASARGSLDTWRARFLSWFVSHQNQSAAVLAS